MRKNHIKLGLSLLTVLATPIIVNTVSSNDVQAAQGWVKSGNSWSFYNQNGTLVRNAWVDNGRYYVGANGA